MMGQIQIMHKGMVVHLSPTQDGHLRINGIIPKKTAVLYYTSMYPSEEISFPKAEHIGDMLNTEMEKQAELDIKAYCEFPPTSGYWNDEDVWKSVLRNIQPPERTQYSWDICWLRFDEGILHIHRRGTYSREQAYTQFSLMSMEYIAVENKPLFTAGLFYGDSLTARLVKEATVRKQIEDVEKMRNPLLIKNCAPGFRWKINVRGCRFDCSYRVHCRYRQFIENMRHGRHKIIVCSHLRLGQELRFSNTTSKTGLPGLGHIIFPNHEAYSKFPSSSNHRFSLRERELHSLLDRCKMNLHQHLDSYADNEELLYSIRDTAEQLFSYIRSEGPGQLPHPENVQSYLNGLGNTFERFLQSSSYPFREQHQVHSSLLKTRNQVVALKCSGTILAEESGSGAAILIGIKSAGLTLPRNARVIIASGGSA